MFEVVRQNRVVDESARDDGADFRVSLAQCLERRDAAQASADLQIEQREVEWSAKVVGLVVDLDGFLTGLGAVDLEPVRFECALHD